MFKDSYGNGGIDPNKVKIAVKNEARRSGARIGLRWVVIAVVLVGVMWAVMEWQRQNTVIADQQTALAAASASSSASESAAPAAPALITAPVAASEDPVEVAKKQAKAESIIAEERRQEALKDAQSKAEIAKMEQQQGWIAIAQQERMAKARQEASGANCHPLVGPKAQVPTALPVIPVPAPEDVRPAHTNDYRGSR